MPKFEYLLKTATSTCMLSSAWQFHRYSNTSFSWLFIEQGFSENFANNIVNGMICLLIISAISLWIPRKWTLYLCLSGAVALLLEALALTVYPPESESIYNLPSHALRYLLPISLCLIHHDKKKLAVKILTIATGLTFFGHGMKALLEDYVFLDYILAFCSDIGIEIKVATGIMLLHIIGTVDIAVAHHISFFKWQRLPWILRYMAFWGLVTACARMTYGGWGSWHELTVRAPHFLVPLALLFSLKRTKNTKTPSEN